MTGTPVQPNFEEQSGNPTLYQQALEGSIAAAWRPAIAFAPHEQSTPDMTVRVEAGPIPSFDADTDIISLTEKAAQDTPAFTAPSTYPRTDRVVIDRLTCVISVVTGVEAASPSPPDIPAGKAHICKVRLQTTTTAITNSMIDDERVLNLMGVIFPTPPDPPTPAMTLAEAPKTFTNALAVSFNVSPLKKYKLVIEAVPSNNNSSPYIIFNDDWGNHYSSSLNQTASSTNYPWSRENYGYIPLADNQVNIGSTHCTIEIDFMVWGADHHKVDVNFRVTATNGAGSNEMLLITGAGRYAGAADMSKIIVQMGNGTFTGKAYLYEIVLS